VRIASILLATSGCVTALHVTTTTAITDGVIAPGFSLPAQNGSVVSLAGELAHGPVVLVFYRGYW
jgi:hypothetical protein